ncbi:IS110 family transposase [Streptomyces sp. NBC_00648]|uniref:IS110 family transposase n=1 Tax=Streptomyces sp. NBC_00648 TaxID=2975797 RepID=UPI00386FF651
MIFCGIDWAERHHDVALVDDTGQLLAKRRIGDDAAGYQILLDLLAEHGDTEDNPIPVAIETSRGLLVAVLRTGRRKVFAVNPMAAARYRDRHGVSRKKSDPGDAFVLANILRTDMPMHRPLPADTDLACAIAVLARAQQDATWNRQQMSNQLRSLLREYYPAALEAFAPWQNGLCRPEARELLKLAPTPAQAARPTRAQLRAAFRRAGRSRGIEAEAERLRDVFRFPGLGIQLGARVLAEIGDDRGRFADARGLKAYAGSAPVTRASGKKHYVGRRMVKNDRLNHAGYLWAFASIRASEGAGTHYRRRREHGDWHAQAQRHLFNRMLGQLHHCLKAGELFDEHQAFPSLLEVAA